MESIETTYDRFLEMLLVSGVKEEEIDTLFEGFYHLFGRREEIFILNLPPHLFNLIMKMAEDIVESDKATHFVMTLVEHYRRKKEVTVRLDVT